MMRLGIGGRARTTERDAALEAAGRWYRPIAVGLTVLFLLVAVVIFVLRWQAFDARGFLAVDYDMWRIVAQRFLDTGSMYFPHQLAGPYELHPPSLQPDVMPVLYPPHTIYLFLPLLVLPAAVWWIVPLGLTAYLVARWRPAPWTWPVIALILALPETVSSVIVGGTTMWMVAFVAAGLRWHWPAVLITIKPSLLPFALIGVRHRSWWVAAVLLGLVSLPMLPLYFDFLAVVRNGHLPIEYSLGSVPSMLLPVVAWLGRRGSLPS